MPVWIWDLHVNDSIRPWYPEAPAEGWIQGDWGVRMWHRRCQSWVGNAVCVSQYECGTGEGGGGLGQIVHAPHPSGRGWMKLFPGLCPSVTVAAAATKVLPWQGGHKKAWRGNGSRGQEWGSGGRGVTASWTAHKRRRWWEKKEGRFGFLSAFRPFLLRVFWLRRETSEEWTPLDINIELGRWDEKRRGL